MPRTTYRTPKPNPLSTHDELRNLSLAITVREKQVKLRRLEWDTQALALPHITPMPGDGKLQVRKPLTQKDMPTPRPSPEWPEFKPGMPHDLYQILINLYMDELRAEETRDPYNKLASISAQTAKEARQEREDARAEKRKARDAR